ncbi:MAG: hypothetical protein ACRDHV_12095, partial [Actinomycetota bacterium]
MSKLSKAGRRVTRSLPLSIVAILVGAAIITPSVSGAAAFLTKQKANKLFLGNTTILSQVQSVPDQQGRQFSILCPPGQQATGGGANSPATFGPGATTVMILLESAPINAGGRSVGWQVEAVVGTGGTGNLDVTAYAICSK